MTAAIIGRKTIRSVVHQRGIRLTSSTAINRATEEDDEDCETDRSLGGGDGEDEHRQHLARQIAEISGERERG